MAENEARFKLILDNKSFEKGTKQSKTSLEGIGKVNLSISQNALKAMGVSLEKASKTGKSFGGVLGKVQAATSKLGELWGSIGDNGLPALRYALYDVANSTRAIAVGAAAFAVTPIGFSIKYEREFANVIRTNELVGASMETTKKQIKSDLLEIAQTTPISWEDVTNIATLAGQLGVAQNVIGRFTEAVAKFSATTDLSVDASATAFGRLDQLIDGIDGKFENLGSAILAVGVDSVATESQIVNVSTQIASMGNLAGLAAPEIIGLSGAIASLGIRPELARGNVTRLFSNIGKSAVEGGFGVAEFGRLTGRTAEEFVSDWGKEPGAVLQDFFDGINKEGPKAEQTLRQLGITSVRDIPALLRLGQNSEEVRRLIELSSREYVYATKITEQYGIISNTTAEQIKRLGQNFQTLQASIGDSVGPLSGLFGILNSVLQGITFISNSNFGVVVNAIAISVALLVAALFTMISAFSANAAALLALRFAASKLGITLNVQLLKALLGNKVALDAVAASAGKSAIAVRLLAASMKAMLITTGIGIAVLALTAAIGHFAMESKTATENVEKFFGSADGLTEAIKKDTEAFDKNTGKMKDSSEALRTFTKDMTDHKKEVVNTMGAAKDFATAQMDSQSALRGSADGIERAAAAQRELAEATEAATGAAASQTMAIGPNTLDFFTEGLLQQGDLVNLFGDPALAQGFLDAGGDLSELLAAGILGDADAMIDAIVANAKLAEKEARRILEASTAGGAERAALRADVEEQSLLVEILDTTLRDYINSTGEAINQQAKLKVATDEVGEAFGVSAEKTNLAKDAIDGIITALFAEANYTKNAEDALAKYASALALTGDAANQASGEIQGVITSILTQPDQSVDIILGNLNGLLMLLEAQGPGTAAAQDKVRQAIREVGMDAFGSAEGVFAYASGLNATVNFDAANFQEIMANALKKTGGSAGGAAKKVKTLAEQFGELVDSMFEAINLGRSTEDAIFSLGEAFGETGDQALYASSEMQDAISSILEQSGSAEEGVANLASLFSGLAGTVGGETAPSLQILRQAISQVAAQFGISEAQAQAFIDTAGGGISNINFDNFNRGIQNAQQEVRTLLDYASDLEAVFSRAFDIRFATTFAIDDIADAWFKLGENVEDARREVEDLIAAQQDLSADRSLKEYFLSVAEAYGDTLRAGILREELAALTKEQQDNAKAIAEAQAIAGGDLTGQGPGQRQNRAALLGLVGDYQGYITALAESGASQDELRKATERARKEFIAQALELGYQEDVVMQYAAAFDDVKTAIDRVPRNITVDANVNPALQALNELNASLNKQISAARSLNAELGKPIEVRKPTVVDLVPVVIGGITLIGRPGAAERAFRQAQSNISRGSRDLSHLFASGGYTGPGGRNEPAGVVHKGEYVVPKSQVNQSSGLPNANFLSQLQNGMPGYAQGGFVGGGMGDGTMMVELSPFDRKLLSDAGNVQLKVDGKVVASATNRSNFNEARRGSN
jgi:TP901 family phage tail tape measure protein